MASIGRKFKRLFSSSGDTGSGAQELLPPLDHASLARRSDVMNANEVLEDRIHRDEAIRDVAQLSEALDDYNHLEVEIRCQLARKIARLLPSLTDGKKQLALDHTIRVLKMLSKDQTERVRQMLAEELADLPDAPYEVVRELAWDPSLNVACPILEFSPLLGDNDLIDIIESSGIPGVVESIARRQDVSETVSTAIVETHQPDAIHALLGNDSAHIDQQSMDIIVAEAPNHVYWHDVLTRRPDLNQSTVNRIAGFVSQNLLENLHNKGKLKQVHKSDTRIAVTHRLKSWTADQERQAELRVRQLHEMGRLDEEIISDAIHAVNEPFVAAALAVLAQMRFDTAKRILRSQSGSAITALAWRAGLSMRTAMALQMKIGRVHHTKMLNARGGTDYPISEFEMETYLEIFTG